MNNSSNFNFADLKTICINTAVKLFELPNKDISNTQSIFSSKIVLPNYHNKSQEQKERVSEQEARFMFTDEVIKYHKSIFYSVETPTKENYKFKDSPPRVDQSGKSARIDISLYDKDKNNPTVNIEFKAKNPEINTIKKDFIKLMAEPSDGLFFHILESVDKSTLNVGYDAPDNAKELGILTKYKLSFKDIQKDNSKELNDSSKLLFFIVSLDPTFILAKSISKLRLMKETDLFRIDYEIIQKTKSESKKIQIRQSLGWDFIDFS